MYIESNKDNIWIDGNLVQLKLNEEHGTHFSTTYDFEGPVVYEVIRVMKGQPLFLNEHLARMGESYQAMGSGAALTWDQIERTLRQAILAVIQNNDLSDNNLKLLIGNLRSSGWSGLVFPIASFYPSAEVYEAGVDTDVVLESRQNPHVKVINENLTDKIARLRAETGIFEALLCNENGEIAEGSKSNVFFIQKGELLTPPSGTVLKGITRQKVIEAAAMANLPLRETLVKASELSEMEAAFLTGTSLHILPIKRIGSLNLNSSKHPLVQKLMNTFEKVVDASQNT